MQGELVADRTDQERGRLRSMSVTAADARAAAFRSLVEVELDRACRLATVILGDRYDAGRGPRCSRGGLASMVGPAGRAVHRGLKLDACGPASGR